MSVTRNSRLLCRICGEVKPVEEIDELITLQCGHLRPEILPLQRGHVSIENINSAAGRRLFPAKRDDVSPEYVDMRKTDRWR